MISTVMTFYVINKFVPFSSYTVPLVSKATPFFTAGVDSTSCSLILITVCH